MAKFCGNCGAQLMDEDKVCGYCGTPCRSNPYPGAGSNGSVYGDSDPSGENYGSYQTDNGFNMDGTADYSGAYAPVKKNKKKLLKILIPCVSVLLVGIIILTIVLIVGGGYRSAIDKFTDSMNNKKFGDMATAFVQTKYSNLDISEINLMLERNHLPTVNSKEDFYKLYNNPATAEILANSFNGYLYLGGEDFKITDFLYMQYRVSYQVINEIPLSDYEKMNIKSDLEDEFHLFIPDFQDAVRVNINFTTQSDYGINTVAYRNFTLVKLSGKWYIADFGTMLN